MIRTQASYEPIIAYANNCDLLPGIPFGDWTVPSRMLLWCHGGEGRIKANGLSYPISNQRFFFLPWNHHITYYPGKMTPLSVSGIHVIPDAPMGQPFQFSVAHHPEERLQKNGVRRDARIAGLDGIVHGVWQDHVPLSLLAEYIVHWYRNGTPAEYTARWLARQLIAELKNAKPRTISETQPLPERLQRILGHIWNHLHLPIGADSLAFQGGCSTTTVQRLFQKYLDDTPTNYILKRRMERAAYLLVDTLYSVADIGRQVGINDPYYFSKSFRKVYGITATQYRKRISAMGQI